MKNVKLPNSHVLQAVLDAVNQRLRFHEEIVEALRNNEKRKQWEAKYSGQGLLDEYDVEYAIKTINYLRVARSALGQA